MQSKRPARGPRIAFALVGDLVVVGWILAMHIAGDTEPAIIIALLATVVLAPLHVVVHEFGHLVVALVLGVRVLGVQLYSVPLFGPPTSRHGSHVRFDLGRKQRALAPRMVAIMLAGPLANLALAVPVGVFAADPHRGTITRAIAAAACVGAALLGVGNLIPFRLGLGHSDGRNLLRWSFGARQRGIEVDEVRARRAVAAASVETDHEGVQVMADDERPAVAGPATAKLLAASMRAAGPDGQAGAVWEHYDLLLRVVRTPGLSPAMVPHLAAFPGMVLATACLQDLIREQRQPDPEQLRRISELVEAGHTAAPGDLSTRTVLSLVRALQDRLVEAQRLLIGVSDDAGTPAQVADAYAVRALTEIELRDLAQARRLIEAAERRAPAAWLVTVARGWLEAVEAPSSCAE